jgi:hypothetical protein
VATGESRHIDSCASLFILLMKLWGGGVVSCVEFPFVAVSTSPLVQLFTLRLGVKENIALRHHSCLHWPMSTSLKLVSDPISVHVKKTTTSQLLKLISTVSLKAGLGLI